MKYLATNRRLRAEPLWKFLASDTGPVVLSMLRLLLSDKEKELPVSIFHERLSRMLEELRAEGENLPQTAQQYSSNWLSDGILERRFPAGSMEEVYRLTTDAAEALRFVDQIGKPRTAATESRLSMVIGALAGIAEDTDTDQTRRIERLEAEREGIDLKIREIRAGRMRIISPDTALERVREVIGLVDDLAADFRRVRDRFSALNRELREKILETEGNRGEVLDSLFAGIDLIADSDAGRTFQAFWRLLTDPEQSSVLDNSLDAIMERDFSSLLDWEERRFLLGMTRRLVSEGGDVHETLRSFASSLRNFVQSREYQEQRRIHKLISDSQKAALWLKEGMNASRDIDFDLHLSGATLRSVSQWILHDPLLEIRTSGMDEAAETAIGLKEIAGMVALSDIDTRALREDIRQVLSRKEQATIGDVLSERPARQGLGSVVGLVDIGIARGIEAEGTENIRWTGMDGLERSAVIPLFYFLKEIFDERR